MLAALRPAFVMLMLMTALTGFAYPLAVTGLAQLLFPHQADGSLVVRDGKVIGSELLAQGFADPKYFHPRPSAAGSNGYDAASSSGSNLGPTSKDWIEVVRKRVAEVQAGSDNKVPVELITASGSGLDPDLSPDAALFQADRVATARGVPKKAVVELVAQRTHGRWAGALGEQRVNVLELNLALDQLTSQADHQ